MNSSGCRTLSPFGFFRRPNCWEDNASASSYSQSTEAFPFSWWTCLLPAAKEVALASWARYPTGLGEEGGGESLLCCNPLRRILDNAIIVAARILECGREGGRGVIKSKCNGDPQVWLALMWRIDMFFRISENIAEYCAEVCS